MNEKERASSTDVTRRTGGKAFHRDICVSPSGETPDGVGIESRKIPTPKQGVGSRLRSSLCWILAALACLWLAICTSLGPLYRQFTTNPTAATILAFSLNDLVRLIFSFFVYLFILRILVGWARTPAWFSTRLNADMRAARSAWRTYQKERRSRDRKDTGCSPAGRDLRHPDTANASTSPQVPSDRPQSARTGFLRRASSDIALRLRAFPAQARSFVLRITANCHDIMIVLILGWLWVPVTLLTAFGADLRSQLREFSWAWNQWTGQKQPYIGFFSFVPMDIYPTAHYMWPARPTYLTDQHNIVLTLFYGSVASLSRYLTGSNDWGLIVLSTAQFIFAAFALASCADRFFNRRWLGTSGPRTIGAAPRCIIIAFLLLCPIVQFSTISLTKSPLFAFAFAWWFSIQYEICTNRKSAAHTRPSTLAALAVSTAVMLCSAKYALYIILIEFLLLLLVNRNHWRTYAIGLLIPVIAFEAALNVAISTGTVIGGDLIESHGPQLQQIARVARLNPNGIPPSARRKLAAIFNLDQMAEAYSQQDADPVKSSGIQSKKVSYRWRTVTKADMKQFNSAWLQTVRANPVIATDALLAKCYGYFDINDPPYVDMAYYLSNSQIDNASTWIARWLPGWRQNVSNTAKSMESFPVLGHLVCGNLYVIMTLLIVAAEFVLKRWRTLACHMPLLLLMGVMITSPANNFERHMLPLVFVFGFVALTFITESYEHETVKVRRDIPIDSESSGSLPCNA
ncbi:DUF6020 family protein [Bifidobacterium bombi]|uniref:Putative membrane protein n=1 Tax=Bifidobacterium bombi DSM 19703 TaxID=1341695 RepID=A0A080N2Z3_9BIFI|nr:DUF6020 family protein [Bifidobacterium bombi]KFF31453.1 putative membrane protein [Bifidobacterium bombi DSM 19703]